MALFTARPKNGNLGINLLMEQKFKKILNLTKDWKAGRHELSATFEGALFSENSWFIDFSDEVDLKAIEQETKPIKSDIIAPVTPAASVETTGKQFKSLVLFIGDKYNGEGEDLLGKMISAMKLAPNEYHRLKYDEVWDDIGSAVANYKNPNEATRELLVSIQKHDPQVVVSLGAVVTNLLTGEEEKLANKRGNFYHQSIVFGPNEESVSYELIPIFHPDYLAINPNMKRTAWIDLQKVMKKIGKM